MIEHIELSIGKHPAEPQGTVIWMHGLGADCWDFVPIVKELGLAESLSLRFIFPQAPIRPITINNGYPMPGWYDIMEASIERKVDEPGVRESQASINELIEREIKRGVPADKIVLAGFSQGGAIALQTGLRQQHPLAGILALSTYLTLNESLGSEKTIANANIPILMAHGTQDPIVPLTLARTSKAQLESHGFRVEWREYAMQHAVCAQEVEDIAAWIASRYQSKILLA
jgi:phospholipase/carboxylesterase